MSVSINGISFVEVAAKVGLNYRWPVQPKPLRNLEAFGTGCAFLDYDNDGWQDILLVNKPHVALFRNRRDGTFADVTAASGLNKAHGDWKGCAVGDVDGDGWLDLLLNGYRNLALLKNIKGQRWSDVTRRSGLDPRNHNLWGSSAGFMDLDGNGTLDLVLCHYVVFGPREKQYCYIKAGIRSGCPPQQYRPEFAELYQNLGRGKFKDVTTSSGMKDTHGKALVVAFADVNDDGKMDFYIGNDGTPAELMVNQGGLKFKNNGMSSGAAFGSPPGHALAAMGADWDDYDRDGRLDLAVSGFSDEAYSILRSMGPDEFEYASEKTGIAAPTFKPLGFGTKWLNADNDEWPDLVFTNGHVYDAAAQLDPLSPYRQRTMLFHNESGHGQERVFKDIAPLLGAAFEKPILGRGLATGDYDNDGNTDILIVDYEGAPQLLHNTTRNTNNWLTLDLRGTKLNVFALGAKVVARVGKRTWTAQVSPTSSYLSSSDPRIHLGLGANRSLETLQIQWPTGRVETLRNMPGNRIVIITEGRGVTASKGPVPSLPS